MVAEGVDVGWRSDNWHCFRAIYYRHIFQKINLISHFVKLFTLKAQQFSVQIYYTYQILWYICTKLLYVYAQHGTLHIFFNCQRTREKQILQDA